MQPAAPAAELQNFHFVFQMSKAVIFEVHYYRLGNNTHKHFSTSAAEFNRPKSDYKRCGQAQADLLPKKTAARRFYEKWDGLHLNDLTPAQHAEILQDIEELKQKYNYIHETELYHGNFHFSRLREFAKQVPKRLQKPAKQ